jgi:hypothetical protein
MNVIGHQAIRVHRALIFLGELPQKRQIAEVIRIAGKADTAIVTTLDDVQSDARKR